LELTWLPLVASLLVTLTSLALLITADWRVSILLLSIQYLGVFLLVSTHWPIGMAIAKLIAGWMTGAVLGMGILSVPELRQTLTSRFIVRRVSSALPASPQINVRPATQRLAVGRNFFLAGALLVGLAIFSRLSTFSHWIPGIASEQAWAGLILIGLGLLKLGFSGQPLHIILGLLTALSGFEILYAWVESSIPVAGLLAGVNLILALAGAYLMVAPYMEEAE